MIPVQIAPEPADFDIQVRIPGVAFLATKPRTSVNQWNGKDYWRRALSDLRISYRKTCAYCAQWIPHGTGNHTVDHFLPKSQYPELAYEWNNFRYVSSRFNGRKGVGKILDPFKIEIGWFVIDFVTFIVKPAPLLEPELKAKVKTTIDILKLNIDQQLVQERYEWYRHYKNSDIKFEYLKLKAPFIAYELERQGLVTLSHSMVKGE